MLVGAIISVFVVLNIKSHHSSLYADLGLVLDE